MLLVLLLLLFSEPIDSPTTYDGREGKLAVKVPRLEVEPAIEGNLDEQVWGEAALLTGFSQFSPTDGVPAADSTKVLVWYSPTAILLLTAVDDRAGSVTLDGIWQYDRFVHGEGIQDQKLHFNANTTLRGGWQVGGSVLVESFGYPEDVYSDYAIELPRSGGAGADTVSFTGTPTIPNLDYVLSLDTPEFSHFSGNVFVLWGRDENFFEWASAGIVIAKLMLDWRPTDKLRLEGIYQLQSVARRTDGRTVNVQRSPRLKLEYQLSRPIFLRLVGEYTTERQAALKDDTRTGAPILIFDAAAGTYVRAEATSPPRARCSLPATAAPCGTQPSSAEPVCGGQRTGSSSS